MDHVQLQEALEKAELLCSQVNEGVREKENSDRLEWIQSHVLCEGITEVRNHILELPVTPVSHSVSPGYQTYLRDSKLHKTTLT